MLLSKAELTALCVLLLSAFLWEGAHAQEYAWQKHAPNPLFASVQDIAVDQSTGTIYVLPDQEQVIYYSEDNGESWQSFPNNVALNPTEIAFNSVTGDLLITDLLTSLWWTSNKGQSWSHEKFFTNPNSGFGAPLTTVEANPHNGDVYVSVLPSLNDPDRFGAIKMPPNMNSWDSLNLKVMPLEFAFASNEEIYITAGGFNFGNNLGVYHSGDAGDNWAQMSTTYVTNITINGEDSIFTGGSNGVKLNEPSTNSWISRNNGLATTAIRELIANPVDNSLFVIDSLGQLYRSKNNGLQWNKINEGIIDEYNHIMAATPGGAVFTGSQRTGMWRLNESNSEWQRKMDGMGSGLTKMIMAASDEIYAIQEHGLSGCVLYTASVDSAWQQFTEGMGLERSRDLVRMENGHLFGSFGTKLYHSDDQGAQWDSIPDQWSDLGANYTLIEQLATAGNELYIRTSSSGGTQVAQILKTEDNGQTWVNLFSAKAYNDTQSIPQDEIFELNKMLVTSAGDVYLPIQTMVGERQLLLREAGTASWKALNTPFQGQVTFTADRQDQLYTYDRYLGDIYMSSNNGQSWDTIENGGWDTLDVNYSSLLLDFDQQNNLYVAHRNDQSGGGMWYRDENNQWSDISASLPNVLNGQGKTITASPLDIAFDEDNIPYVLTKAGIYAYRETEPDGLTKQSPAKLEKLFIFPNPVRDHARLRYQLKEKATVAVHLLDISGRMLAHVQTTDEAPGTHTRSVNLSAVPQGTYFIRLLVDDNPQLTRIVKQ